MRPRLAWLAGAVGVAGAVAHRRLRRVRGASDDPRAAELRRKLDESKTLVEEREEFEAAETTVDAVEPAEVEDRRRDVHQRGRAAAEKMRGHSAE